jgi:hypothetical protein
MSEVFTWTPKPQEELDKGRNDFKPLPPGKYYGHIMSAKVEISSGEKTAGESMLHVEIKTVAPNTAFIHDYIGSWNEWKIRNLVEACGLDYEAGQLRVDDLQGKTVLVKTKIEKGRAKKDGSGMYPDKTAADDYLTDEVKPAPAPADDGPHGEKIPFAWVLIPWIGLGTMFLV